MTNAVWVGRCTVHVQKINDAAVQGPRNVEVSGDDVVVYSRTDQII